MKFWYESGVVVVLLKKDSDLQARTVFLDQVGRLVILDVIYKGKQIFRVVGCSYEQRVGWLLPEPRKIPTNV